MQVYISPLRYAEEVSCDNNSRLHYNQSRKTSYKKYSFTSYNL